MSPLVAPAVQVLAHAVHYVIVIGGLAGVAVLLLPQYSHRSRGAARVPRDLHEERVAALKDAMSTGQVALLEWRETRPAAPAQALLVQRTGLALPLAITSSAAAAGVHAAVGPAHLQAGLLIGSYFVVSSMGQLAWAMLLLRGGSRLLFELGALGNAACIVLWIVTRMVGLPFGITEGPEGVGPWDAAAVVWEGMVVGVCVLALVNGSVEAAVAPWRRWPAGARIWSLASILALGALSVWGAGS